MRTYIPEQMDAIARYFVQLFLQRKRERWGGVGGLRKGVGGGGTLRIFAILSKLRASLILDIQTQGSRTGKVEVGGWVGGGD
jgi:hypothetical protein